MNHWGCICADCESIRRDAERFRWLTKNTTFYNTAESQRPVLADYAQRIWYHATDRTEDTLGTCVDASTNNTGAEHD